MLTRKIGDDRMTKTVLMTGCSSGIGYDAAHGMAARGWRVFATCRKQEDCARLRDEGLESFPLDYEDVDSLRGAVAETLRRTGGRLDALYNNGAYAIPGAVEVSPAIIMDHCGIHTCVSPGPCAGPKCKISNVTPPNS